MSARANAAQGGGGATVVTSQKVRQGRDGDYQRWQEKTNRVVRGFDGFEGTETYPPGPVGDREWVVVFRFSRVDQLTAWLESGARRDLLVEVGPLLERPPVLEVLASDAPAPTREGFTAVISHDVRPGRERDFERWQDKAAKAQEKFPGFMGTELFRPVEGIQENWVVVCRFDTRQHLEDWLESESRAELLHEGHDYFASYDIHKLGTSFSGWFRFGEGAEDEIPPNWKQAMTVVLALYPTVMILQLTVGHEFDVLGIPGSVGLFLSNVLSVSILTWVLMPLVNKALAFWLLPGRSRSLRGQVAGAAVVVLCWLLFIVIFSLTTG